MKYTLDGTEPERVGNRHQEKVPHNVFRCLGDENWVAISVEDDAQFRALAQVAGIPEWAEDPRFSATEARLSHQDELEPLIEQWTLGCQVEDVVEKLQAAGVPAGPVLDSAQVLADPHMIQRGYVQSPDHPIVGPRPMGAFSWTVDGGQPAIPRSAPLFGEHNKKVIQELLQVPGEEFERLMQNGVIR
jgi:crotonobetainyl-CoA:carnitine CoA-transferase CaiB-like acyl-CoA transferase